MDGINELASLNFQNDDSLFDGFPASSPANSSHFGLRTGNVGLFSEGAVIQSQYDISHMVQALGNQISNETSMHQSATAVLKSDPVDARAETVTGIPNEQFITNQRSVLSPGTLNTSHAPYPSYGSHSQLGTSSYNSFASESSASPRPMQALGTRIGQVAPILANTIALQRGRATITSSSWVQPLENVEIEENNINDQNSSHEANSRKILNTLYGPTFGKSGFTFDPHIRAWEKLT